MDIALVKSKLINYIAALQQYLQKNIKLRMNMK